MACPQGLQERLSQPAAVLLNESGGMIPIASWSYRCFASAAKLTRMRLKRGVFVSIANLQEAINRFIVMHNQSPKPFIWTADPDAIIEKIRRGNQMPESTS